MLDKKYVIGLDYGTDSCRGVVIDSSNGNELASEVFFYPRWKEGLYCDPDKSMYRQHPLDYIEGLKQVIKSIVAKVGNDVAQNIAGISVDTTGSTPCAVNREGVPLALLPEFAQNPNAMFVLWKDHTAINQAEEINIAAKKEFERSGIDYTRYVGGVYSSEWFFAKILHILKEDTAVANAAYSWVEHCDFIPALLTGVCDSGKILRSRCAAGHKALWHEDFGGLPPEEFFKGIDDKLTGLRERLYQQTYTSDRCAGTLTKEWADQLGLSQTTKVGIGAFDCHMGAVGGNIKANALVKVIGTSTCDILVEHKSVMKDKFVEGICGQVDGSVIAGMIGMEAGQSGFGDYYAWFKKLVGWGLKFVPEEFRQEDKILYRLEQEAKEIELGQDNIISLDWINGRRTPYANQHLKAAITGLNLSSDAAKIYKSIIESTAYGARAIVQRFRDAGLVIDEVIAIGGVAKKSPLNMQTIANVLNMPIKVCVSEQAVALGAAIFAAVVAGIYDSVEQAQQNMASGFEVVYEPEPDKVKIYDKLYQKYLNLGNFIENNR